MVSNKNLTNKEKWKISFKTALIITLIIIPLNLVLSILLIFLNSQTRLNEFFSELFYAMSEKSFLMVLLYPQVIIVLLIFLATFFTSRFMFYLPKRKFLNLMLFLLITILPLLALLFFYYNLSPSPFGWEEVFIRVIKMMIITALTTSLITFLIMINFHKKKIFYKK